MNRLEAPAIIQDCLRKGLNNPSLRVIKISGLGTASDFGRTETDQKWRRIKYAPDRLDDLEGILPLEITYDLGSGVEQKLNVMMKARTRTGIGTGLIPKTMAEIGLELDRPFPEYLTSRETVGGYMREIEIFRMQSRYPSLQKYLPRYLGDHVDESRNEFILLEELITDGALMDSADDVSGWTPELINSAIEAIADIHAIFYGKDDQLSAMNWLERRVTTEDMLEDESLWRGLAEFTRKRFPDHITEKAYRRHLRIIDTISEWHLLKDAMRHTLVHDDFNPRNSGFRSLGSDLVPVIYDWELALIDIPQRDLVEMLVFTLSDTVSRSQVDEHVERHRTRLESAAATTIKKDDWMEGFRCELFLEAINRVPLQWVFHSRFPSGYAVRISCTLEHLLSLYADV